MSGTVGRRSPDAVIARVTAVRTGRVRVNLWGGREISSAAVKSPVDGRVAVAHLGLEGDEQADRVNHGGPDKAVLLYAGHHYPRWRSDEGLDLPPGAFFENITLTGPVAGSVATGPDERSIVLGETWRLGSAVVQVSQPRSPCYKLAKRWGVKDLVVRVQNRGWTGWYVRVLAPGEVGAGDTVELLHRPDGQPTLAEVARVMNVDTDDLDGARRLIDASGLPPRWRDKLRERLRGHRPDDSARLDGPG